MPRAFASMGLAAIALLAVPAHAAGSHSATGSARNDFTLGAAWQSMPLGGKEHFAFTAFLGPAGRAGGWEVARGDLDGSGPLPPFMFSGPVTCLSVVGNRASFFYEFRRAEPPFFQGGGVQVYVEDNGRPRNGQPVDGTAFDAPIPGPGPGLPPLEGPTVCPPPRVTGYDVVEAGNLVVHDATP
jgi:hypothetical protein